MLGICVEVGRDSLSYGTYTRERNDFSKLRLYKPHSLVILYNNTFALKG